MIKIFKVRVISIALFLGLIGGNCVPLVPDIVVEPLRDLPADVYDMISDSQMNSLEAQGFPVYDGLNPPVVEGAYLADTVTCIYDSGGYCPANISPYEYNFYNQSNVLNEIFVDYRALSVIDNATGVGAFISGDGLNFTVFAENTGYTSCYGSTLNYTLVTLYSATVSGSGFVNWQNALVMTSKGSDPYNCLMNVDDFRILEEGDFFIDPTIW